MLLAVSGLASISSLPPFVDGVVQSELVGTTGTGIVNRIFGTYQTTNGWLIYGGPTALFSAVGIVPPPAAPLTPAFRVDPKLTAVQINSLPPTQTTSDPSVQFSTVGSTIVGLATIPTLDVSIPFAPLPTTPVAPPLVVATTLVAPPPVVATTPVAPQPVVATTPVAPPLVVATTPVAPPPVVAVTPVAPTPVVVTAITVAANPYVPVIPPTLEVGGKLGAASEPTAAASFSNVNVAISSSADKIQTSAVALQNQTVTDDWIGEPTNAARRADLGLSDAKRGAAPDIFRAKFCLVSPGNTAAGNQKFFMGCQ